MTEAGKTEVTASGFAPHIEELHEFFRSRSVQFGAPEDLTPFVERISKDESFRDEMSSMVRAIIYRERDGLTPVELLELMVTAVAGTRADELPEQVRDTVRQVLRFLGGVFRSRWNPGAGDVVADAPPPLKPDDAAEASAAAETARPMTPIFYQAQVVANGGAEPEFNEPLTDAEPIVAQKTAEPIVAQKTKAAKTPAADTAKENMLPLRGKSEDTSAPFLNLAGYAAHAEPVVAFLRGEGAVAPAEPERRQSRGWAWVAIVLAIVVSFGAGMFTRQWMLSHSIPAWPWHQVTTPTVSSGPAAPSTSTPPAVNPGAVQTPDGGAVGAQGAKAVQPRRPAQVEAAQSEWKGADESGADVTASDTPASDTATSPASGKAAASGDGAGGRPMTGVSKPNPEVRSGAARSGEARATMLGASPGLMGNRLLFAPQPEYPELARIAHIQGTVVVEALVGRDGSVVRAHAISGHRLLRIAAEKAVYGRRYRPYVVNDIPMAMRTMVTVNFRLR